MTRQTFFVIPTLFAAVLLSLCSTDSYAGDQYGDLVTLFQEFRKFRQPTIKNGAIDYAQKTMDKQYRGLQEFQHRLSAFSPETWPVSRQVDFHLVRAEMNGLAFQHRVVRPWSRDPGHYADLVAELKYLPPLPWNEETVNLVRESLATVPESFKQAKVNLKHFPDVAFDLAVLAIRDLDNAAETIKKIHQGAPKHHPEIMPQLQAGLAAVEDFSGWLKRHQNKMTAAAGVGVEHYNWLLKNVYLFPYDWSELRTLVELEDNRVTAFQRLEENRNRRLPRLTPVQSQAEYRRSVSDSIARIMAFLEEEEIFTVGDYIETDSYFGSWHGFENPWPAKHDYFFNFSHRESTMEEAHEMVGHHFDQLRAEHDQRPIRGGWRPYKISTARTEGFAFALEELLMHAGYLDKRSPRAREIAYEQSAFRTVRAISDIQMHANHWSLADAVDYCVKNAPHGELLDNSPHLWFELATTLRGVGHHMLMVVGKVQFIKLMRDRAQQLGDKFVLKEFMDEFLAQGLIPFSLARWEMTGYDDEIKKLW